jgi:hypothetical protein
MVEKSRTFFSLIMIYIALLFRQSKIEAICIAHYLVSFFFFHDIMVFRISNFTLKKDCSVGQASYQGL